MELIPHSLTAWLTRTAIRSLIVFSTLKKAITHSELYQQWIYQTLALKLFRGEPAISQLDWNFSPIHSSSAGIATNVGSDLRLILLSFHPGHG